MSVTEDEQTQLERLEAKVDAMLAMLERADQAIGAFVTGPGITRMFKAIARGGKDDGG